MVGILVETARPRAIRDSPVAGWLAVGTVCFGAFMGQLDASIVTLTFPALQRDLSAPLAAVQWVSLAYLLILVGLVAAAGRLADACGRKLVYLHGFAVFTIASAACAFAPDLHWLIGFRVVQAAGAAMLQANSVAIIATSVRRDQLRAALGIQSAAQALGLALGPTAGGLLVAGLGWRSVFWVNVPIGCVALVAGRYLLPRTRERTPIGRFDVPGTALLLAASAGLLLILSTVSGLHLPLWVTALLAVSTLVAAMWFVRRERRAPSPLIDLALVRPRTVHIGLVGAMAAYLVLFAPLTLFPQSFGGGARTGVLLTALPAGFALSALAAERLLPHGWSPRVRSLAGAGAATVAAALLAVRPDTIAWVTPLLVLLGLGLGVFIPANNTAVMAAVPARSSAVGGGLVNMGRGIGTALGVCLVTLCLHAGGTDGPAVCLAALAGCAALAGVTGLSSTVDVRGAT